MFTLLFKGRVAEPEPPFPYWKTVSWLNKFSSFNVLGLHYYSMLDIFSLDKFCFRCLEDIFLYKLSDFCYDLGWLKSWSHTNNFAASQHLVGSIFKELSVRIALVPS